MEKAFRKTGIDIIGDASWGTHLCQFYQIKKDLIDILVPYFKAGLENNEFCMWITSKPLRVKDAKAALKKVVKNLDNFIKKGQIEILDYSEWYTKSGKFDANNVLQGWVEKENQALKRGYDGLRLSGNTFWLEKRDWRNFTDYEEEVNNVIGKYRMIAICTYSLGKCGASEVIDVVSNHQFALIRREGKWVIIESLERKRAEEALLFTRFSIDNAAHTMVWVGHDARFIDVNDAFCRSSGYSREELLSMTVHDIDPDYSAEVWPEFWEKLKQSGSLIFESCHRTKEGKVFPVEIKANFLEYKGKEYHCSFARDITARKRTEDEIRSLAKFPSENPNPVLRLSRAGTILYANEASQALLRDWGCVVGNYAPMFWRDLVTEVLTSRLTKTVDIQYGEQTYSFDVVPILDAGYVNLYGSNITERKRAEELLKKSEALLNETGRMARVGAWEFDVETLEQVWTEEVYRIHEVDMTYRPTVSKGIEFYAPPSRPIIERAVQRAIEYSEPFDVELEFITAKGNHRWVHAIGEAYKEHGKTRRVSGTFQDITERKRAEEALKRKSEEQALLLDNIETRIWYLADPETYRAVNKAHAEFFGKEKEELENKNLCGISKKEEAEVCIAGNKEVFEKKTRLHTEEWVTNAKGEKRLMLITKIPKLDEDGNVEYVVCAAEDITERKRAEEALRESEGKYRNLVESISDVVYTIDSSGVLTYISPVAKNTLGYEPDELIGRQFLEFVHKEDHDLLMRRFSELREGIVRHSDYRVIGKHGDIKWVRTLTNPIIEEGGFVGASGVLIDITERKRVEEVLQASKELFEKTFISQWDAIFLLDAINPPKILDCNPAATKVFGYARQEMVGRTMDFLHVDEAALKEFQRHLYSTIFERGFLHRFEFRMRRKDGTVFPTEHSVTPLEDEQGERIGWVSVVRRHH